LGPVLHAITVNPGSSRGATDIFNRRQLPETRMWPNLVELPPKLFDQALRIDPVLERKRPMNDVLTD